MRLFALLLAVPLLNAPADPPSRDPVAMVLSARGAATITTPKLTRRAEEMDTLYPQDRLFTPAGGQVLLSILVDRRQERTRPGTTVTVTAAGCRPKKDVERIAERRAAGIDLRGLRGLAGTGRAAAVVARGAPEPPRDPELPENPPRITPMWDSALLDARPTFRWERREGATAYRFRLRDAAGVVRWEAAASGAELAYPQDRPPLEAARYTWEAAALLSDVGTRVANGRFSVLDGQVVAALNALRPGPGEQDRAELLLFAAALQQHRAYEAALAVFERLARQAPDVPAYQAALADYYARAGREPESRRALQLANDLYRRRSRGLR